MKLFIKNTEVPYLGGCVVERNYPFFGDEGIENTFSFSHKIPINKETQLLFENIERENIQVNSDLFPYAFTDNYGNQLRAVGRVSDIDDDHYHINIEDTSTSIYRKLKDITLDDLSLDEYEFDTVAEYEAWAKGGSETMYAGRNVSYPLLNAQDFFANDDDIDDANWNKAPILNLWHSLALGDTPGPLPETFLWPCIRTKHITDAIATHLGLNNFLPSGLGKWFIPSNFGPAAYDMWLEKKAYVREDGKIKVKISDFISPISALDFIKALLRESNSIVYGENLNMSFHSRAEILTSASNGIDITAYVISAKQKIERSQNGYQFNYYGDIINVDGREFKEEVTGDPIDLVDYWKDGGRVKIGDVGIKYQQQRKFEDAWFRSFGYLTLAKRYTEHGVTELDGYNTLYQYPFGDMSADMQTYLNWKVKAKRAINVKCYPHRLLLSALNNNQVTYKGKVYLIKQARWEFLLTRIGNISLTIVER
jgi:hypothetical protein